MSRSVRLCVHLLAICLITAGHGHWSYDDTNWKEGVCATGKSQSPINLNLADTVIASDGPIEFRNYDVSDTVTVLNNGHSEQIQGFHTWSKRPHITGGPLRVKYFLQQFHLHWGISESTGSEHTLNQAFYPMEIHFVHFLEGYDETTVKDVKGGIAVLNLLRHHLTEGGKVLDHNWRPTQPVNNRTVYLNRKGNTGSSLELAVLSVLVVSSTLCIECF